MKDKVVALDAIQNLIECAEGTLSFRWAQYYKEMGKEMNSSVKTLILDDIKERIAAWNRTIALMRNLSAGIVPTLTPEQLFEIQNELKREIAHRKHMSNVFRKKMRFDDEKWRAEFNKFLDFRDRAYKMQTLINQYYSKQTLFG